MLHYSLSHHIKPKADKSSDIEIIDSLDGCLPMRTTPFLPPYFTFQFSSTILLYNFITAISQLFDLFKGPLVAQRMLTSANRAVANLFR